MTDPNKAAVLAKWPDAIVWTLRDQGGVIGGYAIVSSAVRESAVLLSTEGPCSRTEPEAWADAARRLK